MNIIREKDLTAKEKATVNYDLYDEKMMTARNENAESDIYNSRIKNNLDKILNYENYIKNNTVVEPGFIAEDKNGNPVKTYENKYAGVVASGEKKIIEDDTAETETPSVSKYAYKAEVRPETMPYTAPSRKYGEDDLKPTVDTMKYASKSDIYENVSEKDQTDNKNSYSINTKGKILIAVYALVVITVFALIMLNSRMLKNMDSSIDGYNAKINGLTEQVETLNEELNYVKSDEVIISKAEDMGMVKD